MKIEFREDVPDELCTWKVTRCTKCGFLEEQTFIDGDICEDTFKLVEQVFTKSKFIKNWDDVLTKCHSVLCLNPAEYKTGLTETDVILENLDTHYIIEEEDKSSLLLIVIHDNVESNHFVEEKLLSKVLKKGHLSTLEELTKSKCFSSETKECKEEKCHDCKE